MATKPASTEEVDSELEEGEVREDPSSTTTEGTTKDLESKAASLPTPPPSAEPERKTLAGGDSPLARIIELLPEMSVKDQEQVRLNIERLGGYPRELPLSTEWSAFCLLTSCFSVR